MNVKQILIRYKYSPAVIVALATFVILPVAIVVYGAHQGGRVLTAKEAMLASAIFGNEIILSDVRITFGSIYSTFAPVTLGNTIHIKSSWLTLPNGEDLTFSAVSRHTFIHELAHVHQYQHGGWNYLVKSFIAQFFALLTSQNRNAAYVWEDRVADNTPYADWNPEEQAQSISDYQYFLETHLSFSADKRGYALQLGCFVPVLVPRFCLAK